MSRQMAQRGQQLMHRRNEEHVSSTHQFMEQKVEMGAIIETDSSSDLTQQQNRWKTSYQAPVFERIFRDARLAQGNDIVFEGKIIGEPKPNVEWTFRNRPLDKSSKKYTTTYDKNSGIVTLTIVNIGQGDIGEYVCRATNQFGEAVCSVFIQPEGTPYQSQTNTFSEMSRIGDKRSYFTRNERFQVDNFEYKLLKEMSFRESVTQKLSDNVDSCVKLLKTSDKRYIGNMTSPQIIQKPRNSKLVEESDGLFQTKIVGNPKPIITWFKDGVKILKNDKYEIDYRNDVASLRIHNLNQNDSGHYTVLAENIQGCVVASAYLAVDSDKMHDDYCSEESSSLTTFMYTDNIGSGQEPGSEITFLDVPQDREIIEGKMTRFDCRISGKPNVDVYWFINNKQINNDITHKILINSSQSFSMVITNVRHSDNGIVTCVAKNKFREISTQCKLIVIEKERFIAPKFIERFNTTTIKEGESVTLHVRVIGTPLPQLTWQKDGINITESDNVRIIDQGMGVSRLEIMKAKASDAAWYQCIAQNIAGSTTTKAKLFVQCSSITSFSKNTGTKQTMQMYPMSTRKYESASGSEIVYLREVEHSIAQMVKFDEDIREFPIPKFTQPLHDVNITEGSTLKLEAKIEPATDPSIRVEWLLNSQILRETSRINSVFKLGYISLSIINANINDSGQYECRVTSTKGIVESKSNVIVKIKQTFESMTQSSESIDYLSQIQTMTTISSEDFNNEPAKFTKNLSDPGELVEGQSVHFETQVIPESDSSMKLEWFKDNVPITASSRISTFFNFGYVSLNIAQLRSEDSGIYTVKAINKYGEDSKSSVLKVLSRLSVTADLGIPEQQRYIEGVEYLESLQNKQHMKYVQETPDCIEPPVFKTLLKDQNEIKEDGFAHFEARIEPIGDSTMKIQWLKDGKPLEASSRISTFFNFGYVALSIKSVSIHDVGNYTCFLSNALGQATSTAQLSVVSKKDVSCDVQYMSSFDKIQIQEESSLCSEKSTFIQENKIIEKPRFLGPLKGTNKIVEGQSAHFETRIEPQNDLTMNIVWYFNGNVLETANRIKTYYDFGYVALDISNVRENDSGTYSVIARNSNGEAQLSTTMKVETRSSIDKTSIHKNAYEKTRIIEHSKKSEPQYEIEDVCVSKPVFVQPLTNLKPISEGQNVHLECRLEPMGDPTMRVEWFFNGRPITVGSRFRTYYDFGYVALDIAQSISSDSGEYTARAVNKLGSAQTSAQVRIIEKSSIILDTQNESSLEQIHVLEDLSRYHKKSDNEINVIQAPFFTKPLHNIETIEGTNIHLECRLQPVGDPTMKIEWYVNGHPLKIGHRFRPAYDFDYVALDLLSVYSSDSGVYTCQAINQLGEAVTSCSVKIHVQKDLILDTNHPSGLEKIHYMEESTRIVKHMKHDIGEDDEIINIKPRFLTRPKNLDNMRERQHAHFECKLEPVTDPYLKVEWFKNGKPITIGHRFRPIHDFGYVALDIIDLIAEDSGIYTCRAVNLVGSDETSCTLKCYDSSRIITTTQNEQGLEQIHQLEDRSRYYKRKDDMEEITNQAPTFTTSPKNIEIKEGQKAHFECRLIPVSDPTMRIEWYHNNSRLKSGSRFNETHNFGFVALDILYCYPEDSGTYTCRAMNIVGEAVTSATCIVHSKKSIYFESQHEDALSTLHQLESYSKHQKKIEQEEIIRQAPMFTMPIKDLYVIENQAAHFECRLIPVGDPKLKVDWLRNGVPITASNRITTMHDFGYVALNMRYVGSEDAGTYTCRATNEFGQAVTSSTLFVQTKASLQMGTQHEGALHKIRKLEDSSRYYKQDNEEIEIRQVPIFTVQLNGPTKLIEGQSAHYECRIEPFPDPSLKVEWLFNGKCLQIGHRFRTSYDFGFATLDILTVYGEDSGEYTCRVTNKYGQVQSSIKLQVQTKQSIIMETQNENSLRKIRHLEDDSKYKKNVQEKIQILEKPQFGKPLKNISNLPEGKLAHYEATLTPVNDPTMKVEWLHEGKPITQGHRFKTVFDFGFVALDILYAYTEDAGNYMCKATNAVGEAITTASLSVIAKDGLQLDTLDEQRLEKIRQLESYEIKKETEEQITYQKPIFLTPLISIDNLKESEHAHLECRVEPINDPHMKIEWYHNGRPVKTGSRFHKTHDFGYVALDILYTYSEDSGTYICKARNLAGEAVNTCTIRCGSQRSLLLDTLNPSGLGKIRELEAHKLNTRPEIEEPPSTEPRFIVELIGTKEVHEGNIAHFEAQIEPIHDSSLRVEFYHNDKLLPSAARFHTTSDFGYISLDIDHTVPEDAGKYSVRAFNHLGQCVSSTYLKVIGKDSIIRESQCPEGLEKIKQLENAQSFKRPDTLDTTTKQRPVFIHPLQNIDYITEAQTACFEAHLIPIGDPTLKVEWFRNEKLIETSSRITTSHDFGFVSMHIKQIREEDEGIYICKAVNSIGEAVTTASMTVKSFASIQRETQHPEGMRRIEQLEQTPERPQDSPESVFSKPIFTQLLIGPAEVLEGQSAYFEARVVPVGDPHMKFEWFKNGSELKLGSRIHVTNDFGYITLEINSCILEDSGIYMCKARNNVGEAISSINMKVKTRDSIMKEPIQPMSWTKIQQKEAELNQVPEKLPDDLIIQQAPIFTTHLESMEKLTEGQHVYIEAHVEPKEDPNLRIEWFKNSSPLSMGARIRSTFDFGLISLSINDVRADDSGIYTCKATNLIGQAVSTSSIKVEDKHWLMSQTLHPEALEKIEYLEEPKIYDKEDTEAIYGMPVFISHINDVECIEGETAHFECKVEPSKDPTLQIDWFINNKPLPAGSRFRPGYDFGYISLNIDDTYESDSAIYTCKASNSMGSVTTSGTLKCKGKKSIYFDTQHPQGQSGLEKIQETEDHFISKQQKPHKEDGDLIYPKPLWIVPLDSEFILNENENLHLECTVEPKDDPNLKIEWFFNSKTFDHGSRFRMTNDFGIVILDLAETYNRDQGIYTCKASNLAGEAFTSTTIYCNSKESLIKDTQHPKGEQGLEKIQDLESSLQKQLHEGTEPEIMEPPKFTSQFVNLEDIDEGDIAHFEASLTPIGDSSMKVEWYYNGQQLKASHRIRTVYAFGMVVLEILGTKISDSGCYSCTATNKCGKDQISVNLNCTDKTKGQKPKFTSHIQDLLGLNAGQSAHFECTLTPTNDPDLKIEWLHNNKPLRQSSRMKSVCDFGYVLLDISYLEDYDSGEYICRAYNKYGEDFTKATIHAIGKSGVFSESLQPESLSKIREFENLHKNYEKRPSTSKVFGPPKFVTVINDIESIIEGQGAHFEAKLIPTDDPDLKVEWYFNGEKLPHGHRYRTFFDFGIVILDILYCYEENSGVYECRATNKYGQDCTKATLKCFPKSGLVLDSQLPKSMEKGLKKIRNLEDNMTFTKKNYIETEVKKAPVFIVPLSNIDDLKEGENAHFEARLIPTDDAKLKIDWFWNGKPLKAGSRFRTFSDFGFVILEISPVYPEDSGEYSCRAFNDYGEAVTAATMKVHGKRSIVLESQLPKGMEHTIDRIAQLEGLSVSDQQIYDEDDYGKPPEFITVPNDLIVNENTLAHFECRLIPVNDSSMRVEWFHNGKPLLSGSRIKTINDFGFVILEISGIYQRDAGLYTCKATNRHGQAVVTCNLQVLSRQNVILEPQLPTDFQTGTESIQKLEEARFKKEDVVFEEEKPQPPRFTKELNDNIDIPEGKPIHFDCRVEPVNDSTLRIDWFHNGKPFATGSRVHMVNDFGYVSLDIDYTYVRDSGEYICRATNKWGNATTKAVVTTKSKKGIDFESQLPSGGISAEKLKELERGPIIEPKKEEPLPSTPPKFLTHIESACVEEAEAVHFECLVEPKKDPTLRIEWYRNGKLLPSGHRYRITHEMGFVVLDILYVYPEDSGEYVCRAVNNCGEDFTRANVVCKQIPAIILQNQVPKGMKQAETLMQMEATIKKYTSEIHLTEDDLYDQEKKQPPRFVTQITDKTELKEMESVKFECQLAPVGDPNMKVEWYFNGKPLLYKNRLTPIYDFGYVAMNFNWVYPEDSGEYVCKATNLYGSDETRAVIKTTGKPGIIYDSQLPKGMKSIEKIREMEASWQVSSSEQVDEEVKEMQPPVFVSHPEKCTVEEGEWARFCCRVIGCPRPRVMWLLNGRTIVNGSKYKLTYDGMYHLDIPKTRQFDTGKIEIIARNSCGEAITETELKIIPRNDDYRNVLKNAPRRIYGTKEYRKPKWVTHMEEIQTHLKGIRCSPAVIQELKDLRAREGESVKFECMFSGYPIPDVVWYHDNIIIQDNNNVKIETTDKKTICKIKRMSKENIGAYTCKITNDVGVNISKAKLSMMDRPKSEDKIIPEIPKIKKRKPIKPKAIDEIQDETKHYERSFPETQKATTVVQQSILERATISEVKVQEILTKIRIIEQKTALEIEETIESLKTEELKPVETPIKQLAKIGYYIQQGVTSEEIMILFNVGRFNELTAPNVQSALVNVVERLGHSAIVTQVLSQATADDQSVTSTIGFRAFMRMIEMSYVTIEEVLTHLTISDFEQPIWQTKQATQTIMSESMHTATSESIEIKEDIYEIRTERRIHTEEATSYTFMEEKHEIGIHEEILYAICDIMMENEERIFLKSGDKVFVLERNMDRVYVRKDNIEETQWVKSNCLMSEIDYKQFIQKQISEKVEITHIIEKPSPPRGPMEIFGMTMTSFSIMWKPPENSGSSELMDYIIEIREDSTTSEWKKMVTIDKNTTMCPLSNLKCNQRYFMRVFARNHDGAISDPLNYDDGIIVGQHIRKSFNQNAFDILLDYILKPEDMEKIEEMTSKKIKDAKLNSHIEMYIRGKLRQVDEYFFKLWHKFNKKPFFK